MSNTDNTTPCPHCGSAGYWDKWDDVDGLWNMRETTQMHGQRHILIRSWLAGFPYALFYVCRACGEAVS